MWNDGNWGLLAMVRVTVASTITMWRGFSNQVHMNGVRPFPMYDHNQTKQLCTPRYPILFHRWKIEGSSEKFF